MCWRVWLKLWIGPESSTLRALTSAASPFGHMNVATAGTRASAEAMMMAVLAAMLMLSGRRESPGAGQGEANCVPAASPREDCAGAKGRRLTREGVAAM